MNLKNTTNPEKNVAVLEFVIDKATFDAAADNSFYTYQEDTLLLEKTPCFIWSANGPDMEVDKTLNTADFLPTVLNLLGVESLNVETAGFHDLLVSWHIQEYILPQLTPDEEDLFDDFMKNLVNSDDFPEDIIYIDDTEIFIYVDIFE